MQLKEVAKKSSVSKISKFETDFTKCVVCQDHKSKPPLQPQKESFFISSVSNGIQTHNQLVRKRTLNHLAKLAKCLSCVVSIYLYGAFDCIL